ncbi:hypothetical protein HHI36_020096 [Cryptolaemus montrouzieri]|uniref:Discoidin domain-containing receptor 2-like n=1 Tax=Cryptolaemus montrouzieri TaxID=559131 RepID=A0ABD2NAF8_9CUCU
MIVLKGNINTYLEAKRELDLPMWATKVRFYPYSYHKRTVCMRVELYGCRWTDGLVSYSMPQGDKRGSNWEFYDFAYDGHWEGDDLQQGLGQLVDGRFGHDDFKSDFYNEGQAWVGWKNDTRHNTSIDITFEFDKVREFSAVHIFCNNQFTKEVKVFSLAKVLFSVGGKHFNRGEPITFEYIEDLIFEVARNVTIKLHHRVGRFVKVQLYFSSKWLMVSEITFDSIIAHGNFTVEAEPTTIAPSKIASNDRHKIKIDVPSSDKISEPTYLTIIVIALIIIVILLKVFIFIVCRMRSKKMFRSPNSSDVGYAASTCPHLQADSMYGVSEKGSNIEAYGVTEIDDYRRSHGSVKSSMKSTLPLPYPCNQGEVNEYQEPYQAMKYAPYYSYSPVIIEMQDSLPNSIKKPHISLTDTYDYAVPEAGTSPLLGHNDSTLPMSRSRMSSVSSKSQRISSRNSHGDVKKQSPTQQEALNALKRRLEETALTEFPRHRLRMISKLSEGAFGTVYIAEADGILEYSTTMSVGTRLVAIKFLGETASEKEKKDFYRDVRILAALEDPNIARVLGVCTQEDPMCVIFEYLDHGDLCQFLKTHVSSEHGNTNPYGAKSLSHSCLLYMGTQVASGMRYLESLNFVHRDLATRNCLIGKAYQVKICDFGTYNEIYVNDYYKVDGNTPLPIRWMSWEAVFQAKYTTKSDVWAFAVLFWEILTLARRQPYDTLSDREVMENLANLVDDDMRYLCLPKPTNDQDIYKLMLECWKRNYSERPTFTEIHLFLQRKNLGYAPS